MFDKCYFCTELRGWVDADSKRTSRYAIKLIVYKNEEKNSSEYALNYCPVCGAKIDLNGMYNGDEKADDV